MKFSIFSKVNEFMFTYMCFSDNLAKCLRIANKNVENECRGDLIVVALESSR
jgi:hypothetical protein